MLDEEIVMRYVTYADGYFNLTLVGEEWAKLDEGVRKRAIGQSLSQVQGLRFQVASWLWWNTPPRIMQAVAIQALHLIQNHDRKTHIMNVDNGVLTYSSAGRNLTQGKVHLICVEAMALLKPYMMRGARLT